MEHQAIIDNYLRTYKQVTNTKTKTLIKELGEEKSDLSNMYRQWGGLPQEVGEKIFFRLPAESLVNCSCVCKHWRSLIRNPYFIYTHLNRTISNQNHLFCSISRLLESLSLRNNPSSALALRKLQFPFDIDEITASCNGLLCLVRFRIDHHSTFILWNPCIKKLITLPNPCTPHSSCGFARLTFDSRTNDYKLLKINDYSSMGPESEVGIELYSLNANSWKSLTAMNSVLGYEPRYYNFNLQTALVNGAIHWLVNRKKEKDGTPGNVIVAFKVHEETFHEILVPKCLEERGLTGRKFSVEVHRGSSILVAEASIEGHLHIWVMKEYGLTGAGSWTKMFRWTGHHGGVDKTLGLENREWELLLQKCGHFSDWVGPKTDQMEEETDIGLLCWFLSSRIDYVESLELFDLENLSTRCHVPSKRSFSMQEL